MSHLSRDERLLALDGALDEARQAHLAGCVACRTEVEGLRVVLARVRAVEVPEPSPLFWDHLAARVGDAIAREPLPAAARGWWSPRLGWAAAVVVAGAAAAGYLTRPVDAPRISVAAQTVPSAPAPPIAGEAPAPGGGVPTDVVDGPAAGDGWALVLAVADEVGPDEAFAPAVGQAELSISSLSPEERRLLAGELAAELSAGRVQEG